MTVEQQLIQKKYYENLMIDDQLCDAVQFFGQLYIDEQSRENADLSPIRFSQGELYFHHKDYESAIFKWEKVHSDLEQWAKKNMADAYYQLGLSSTAVKLYQSIESENLTLNSEVALQLFSIYKEEGQLDFAAEVIKRAVSFNPDYPNVTTWARMFFEEYRDWSSAIELAVNEAIRTKQPEWFEIVNKYVVEGLTKQISPEYFLQLLEVLNFVEQDLFEQMVVSLWKSYENTSLYFSWINEINRLLSYIELDLSANWASVSTQYQKTYFQLVNGDYLIQDLAEIVPALLTNWLQVASSSFPLFPATAVLSWNEIFESSINSSIVEKAEKVLSSTSEQETDSIELPLKLYEEIVRWAENLQLDIDLRLKWMVEKSLELHEKYLVVAGMTGNGKAATVNHLLGTNNFATSPKNVIFYSNDKTLTMNEITETSMQGIPSLDVVNIDENERNDHLTTSVVHVKMPCKFLSDNMLTIVDIPDFDRSAYEAMKNNSYADLKFFHIADGILVILTATTPFSERERDLLLKLQEQIPNAPIHFLLKTDTIYHEEEVEKIVKEIQFRIKDDFPHSRIFPFSKHNKSSKQMDGFSQFIQAGINTNVQSDLRNEKLLFYIRETLTYLLKKRVETENKIAESILWKEDLVSKLTGANHQLSDLKNEKMHVIKSSFQQIKDDIKTDVKTKIPKLLKDCSALINENSDFQKIHIELNQKMNERVQNYIEHTILPRFSKSIHGWIDLATEEFNLSQDYLKEMSEGFNRLYGEQRLLIECDFKVLDDWTRDAQRLANGVPIDHMNILNRSTPSQLLLKSASKLFGTVRPNKTMLSNMYKKFIENEDYEKLAETVTNQFILQFELIEKGIERDISMFFSKAFRVIDEVITEEQSEIQSMKETLEQFKAYPEKYLDPITLFKVRLRQCEWIQKERPSQLSYS